MHRNIAEQDKKQLEKDRKKAEQEHYQREIEKLKAAEEEELKLEQQRKERNQQWQQESLKILERQFIQLSKQISKGVTSAEAVVVDIETTGLESNDEILELSIVSESAEVLFTSYFRPLYLSDWSDAESVNSITPDSVSSAPLFAEKISEINSILSNAKKIIFYNADFVLWYLKKYGVELSDETEVISVMELFSKSYGEYNEYYEDYHYQSLEFCAEYYNYEWGTGHNHESISDCLAILHCWNKMK